MDINTIKRIVDENRNYIDIPDRAAFENMIFMTYQLMKEFNPFAAKEVRALFEEIENMDTEEFIDAQIWVD